jgi:hypothetical protein
VRFPIIIEHETKNAMKSIFCSSLFLLASFLGSTASRAESIVLDPSEGLSRASIYGPTDDGPPGLIGQSFVNDTNGGLFNNYDGRDPSASGFIIDQLLLYNLHRLTDATLSDATLTFHVDSAIYNNDPGFQDYAFVNIVIAGSNNNTLGPDDYTAPSIGKSTFGVLSGDNSGTVVTVDVTGALVTLLNQGFDYATVFFAADSSTITTDGPLQITFTQAPTLSVSGTGIHPEVPTVPEASSIIQLGISIVGLGLYALRGKARPR